MSKIKGTDSKTDSDKKVFTGTFISQLIIQLVVQISILLVALLTMKVQPFTAAETLKKESFLNGKKDAYNDALELITRAWAHNYKVEGETAYQAAENRLTGINFPNELEVNTCLFKLCIYSENAEIPATFSQLIAPKSFVYQDPALHFNKFIKLISKDLGYGESDIDSTSNKFNYIMIVRRRSESLDSIFKARGTH